VSTLTAQSEAAAGHPPGRGHPRRSRSRLARRRRRAGILLSLPAVAVVVALLGIPIAQAVYYSMTNWNGLTATWIGPSAYTTALSDPTFWRVLENNALLLLSIPFAIGIPLGIAALLHEHVRGWRFFRSVYFLPTAVSWVVIGMVAVQFFAYQGLLNKLLADVGLGSFQTNMLAGQRSALVALAITFIWSMLGTNTIIFLTGMSTLDPTLLEASADLGSPPWRGFLDVTLPLSLPGVIAGSMLVFIPAVGEFVIPSLLGGPNTLMIGRVLWDEFFGNHDWPVAAAVAIAFLLLLAGPIAIYQYYNVRQLEA